MKMVLLLFLVTIILVGCKSEEGKQLVWSDEFSSAGQPDSSKWNYDLGDGCPNVCGWETTNWNTTPRILKMFGLKMIC